MSWHVIVRVGDADTYEPPISDAEPRLQTGFERPGDPWRVGNDVLRVIGDAAKRLPSGVARDLVYLAMATYAADLRVPRDRTEDRWSRDLIVYMPVSDPASWKECSEHLARTLAFLTGDRWSFHFRAEAPGRNEPALTAAEVPQVDAICLFSGGLDSFIGACDLLANGRKVALVGHHGAGITNSVQDRVLAAVSAAYPERVLPFMFHAQPPKRNVKDGEPSMRSRSFLFFAMGTAVASALGGNLPLVVAENGLITLNVPLTASRHGSLSTRTTHPHYVSLFSELLTLLGLDVTVELPYRFKTKGEMLRDASDQKLVRTVASLTMSCSHPEAGRFRGLSPGVHCGYCVPCIIRRASMKAAQIGDATYTVDVGKAPPSHREEAGRDVRAFRMALARAKSMGLNRAVFTVLGPGPLPPGDVKEYAGVYLRGMEEVRGLLGSKEPT